MMKAISKPLSVGGTAEPTKIEFKGPVTAGGIVGVLFFLNLEIFVQDDDYLYLEYVCPMLNIRHVSTGRALEVFNPILVEYTSVDCVLSVKDEGYDIDHICGCNIFRTKNNLSSTFDFNISDEHLLHFFMSFMMKNRAEEDDIEVLDHYGEMFTSWKKNLLITNDDAKEVFKHLFEHFLKSYNNFEDVMDFKDLIASLESIKELVGNEFEISPEKFKKLPIELQAILKFQEFIRIRLHFIDGNHRTTQLLLHFFDFELEKESKSLRIPFASISNESRLERVKGFSFKYLFLCKEKEVDNQRYYEACRKKSETIQTQASSVIPIEDIHEILGKINIVKDNNKNLAESALAFTKAIEENMKIHVDNNWKFDAIRNGKHNHRRTLFRIYNIPEGRGIDAFKTSEPTTTLYTLLYGTNHGRKGAMIEPSSAITSTYKDTVILLDDCYNVQTLEYVINLFDALYSDLHSNDTKEHNIHHTLIINQDLCNQVLVLQTEIIKLLVQGVGYLTKEGRVSLSYVSNTKTHQVTDEVMRKKAKVVVSVFSFFSILFIVEEIGLFPVIPEKLWKYKETFAKSAPMNCSILGFLSFVFNHKRFQELPFYDCFSDHLACFLKDYHESDDAKPDIFTYINTSMYKEKVANWVRDYAILNFYNEFYEDVIIHSQKKFGQLEIVTLLSRNFQMVKEEPSTGQERKKSIAKKRKSSSLFATPEKKPKPTGDSVKDEMVFRRRVVDENAGQHRHTRRSNNPLCADCQHQHDINNTSALYLGIFEVETKDGVSGTTEKFYYCSAHAKLHFEFASNQGKYTIVCEEGVSFEVGDQAFSPLQTVPFQLIDQSLMSDTIKNTIRYADSPTGRCDVNKAMFVECSSQCNLRNNCKNKTVSTLRTMHLGTTEEIKGRVQRRSTNSVKGDGLFALKKFVKGEGIIEIVGKAFLNDEQKEFPDSNYIMHLHDGCYLDCKEYGNLSRYINHSCDPNTKVQKYVVEGIHAVVVIAIKDISKNEEITYNYGARPKNAESGRIRCLCGANKCKKFIGKGGEAVEEVSFDDANSEDESDPDYLIRGCIENNQNEKDSICYFSVAIQFLFRGIDKSLFQGLLDPIHASSVYVNPEATIEEKVLCVAKTILGGGTFAFNEDLRKLAVATNNDKDAINKKGPLDTEAKYANFYDARRSVDMIADFFFRKCIVFWYSLGMADEDEQQIPGPSKRKSSKKKRKKMSKKKTNKESEESEAEAVATAQTKFKVFNLQSILTKEIVSIETPLHENVDNVGFKYFMVELQSPPGNRMENRVTNTMALKVDCAVSSINGFAILKSFIYLTDYHYVCYVHDRNFNRWILYDDHTYYADADEGTGLACHAAMLLYEYCTEEVYDAFIKADDTVLAQWNNLVEKVVKIVHLMYFLQSNKNGLVAGFNKFLSDIESAIMVEVLCDTVHHHLYLVSEKPILNIYGKETARALTYECLQGYNGVGPWKNLPQNVTENFRAIVKRCCKSGDYGSNYEQATSNQRVSFFKENVYPDLRNGILMGEHNKLNRYFNQTVIIGAMNEALSSEEGNAMDDDNSGDMMVGNTTVGAIETEVALVMAIGATEKDSKEETPPATKEGIQAIVPGADIGANNEERVKETIPENVFAEVRAPSMVSNSQTAATDTTGIAPTVVEPVGAGGNSATATNEGDEGKGDGAIPEANKKQRVESNNDPLSTVATAATSSGDGMASTVVEPVGGVNSATATNAGDEGKGFFSKYNPFVFKSPQKKEVSKVPREEDNPTEDKETPDPKKDSLLKEVNQVIECIVEDKDYELLKDVMEFIKMKKNQKKSSA